MQGREELTLDHAIERAAAAGTLVRHEVVSVFLEVLLLAVDSTLVPEPSRVVLTDDGSLSFTQPPAAASVNPALPVHAACKLAISLFRAAKLEPPLSLRGGAETATERFPTLRHVRDAFELELLMSGGPPPTDVERRMAIAALMAKARRLRGTSAGPQPRRAPKGDVGEVGSSAPAAPAAVAAPELPRVSPHAAITTPAFHVQVPQWIRDVRVPAWMRRPRPDWIKVGIGALVGALVAMVVQRGSGKQPPPPQVSVAAPVPVEVPREPAESRTAVASAADPRATTRDRPATPPSKTPARERANAAQPPPQTDASPRPVRPLRRRVAGATEASAAARAKLQQGDESLREGRLFEAVVAFRDALDSDPTYAAAARRLGDAYREHHDTALAIAAYERYLEMDPSAADAAEVRSALEELRGPTVSAE
jgi:hypothetical protein